MTRAVYETIKRFAQRETHNGLLGEIPVIVDEDRAPDSILLANREVRLCMADFVELRQLAVKDELGLL